jgi:hypothetical protein
LLLCADEAACGVFPVLPFLPFFYGAGHTTLFSPAASDLGAHHPPVRQETAEGDPPPNKREVFPICAARAGLFAPPRAVLFLSFLSAHISIWRKKKKKRDDKQPPNHHPALIPQRARAFFRPIPKPTELCCPPPLSPSPCFVSADGRCRCPACDLFMLPSAERRTTRRRPRQVFSTRTVLFWPRRDFCPQHRASRTSVSLLPSFPSIPLRVPPPPRAIFPFGPFAFFPFPISFQERN